MERRARHSRQQGSGVNAAPHRHASAHTPVCTARERQIAPHMHVCVCVCGVHGMPISPAWLCAVDDTILERLAAIQRPGVAGGVARLRR